MQHSAHCKMAAEYQLDRKKTEPFEPVVIDAQSSFDNLLQLSTPSSVSSVSLSNEPGSPRNSSDGEDGDDEDYGYGVVGRRNSNAGNNSIETHDSAAPAADELEKYKKAGLQDGLDAFCAEESYVKSKDETLRIRRDSVSFARNVTKLDTKETFSNAVNRIKRHSLFRGVEEDMVAKKQVEKHEKRKSGTKETKELLKANFDDVKKSLASPEDFEEWFDLIYGSGDANRGSVRTENLDECASDLYSATFKLEKALNDSQKQLAATRKENEQTRSLLALSQREREFYRLHLKRTHQEKQKLEKCLANAQTKIGELETRVKSLDARYDMLLRQRTLAPTVAMGAVIAKKQEANKSLKSQSSENKVSPVSKTAKEATKSSEKSNSAQKALVAAHSSAGSASQKSKRHKPEQSAKVKTLSMPVEDRANTYLERATCAEGSLVAESLRNVVTIKAHELPVSSIAMHPTKLVLATGSDDRSWKLWSLPSGNLLMSGTGHSDWISCVAINPIGSHLATASGDQTLRLWDFGKECECLKLTEHTRAVWGCAFHDTGDFLLSCSMDTTTKVWDLSTGRCQQTFRGHTGSVNAVAWKNFSNLFFSASSDKTVHAWDARTGRPAKTLFGHRNAVNSLACSFQNTCIASGDADGIVKLWDLRMAQSELNNIDHGPHPINQVSIDLTDTFVATAGHDGVCRVSNLTHGPTHELHGYADAVQGCLFSNLQPDYLVTASSDGTWRLWN